MGNMEKWKIGRTENGYGAEGIILKGGDGQILSVLKNDTGFVFREECDGYFLETYSKEDALKIIDELRDWINAT